MAKKRRKIEAKSRPVDEEKVEREKRRFMWVAISCIMAVFVIAWLFNLKHQFSVNANKSNESGFNWSQTKAELDKAMTQIKQGIAEIKQIKNSEPELTEEQINALKGKLMNETASSTIK